METKLKFKGTPGPWEVADIDDGWKDCVSARAARGDVIAVSHNEDRTTAEANARLIAAAPELLELCIKIRDFLGDGIFDGWDDDTVFLDAEVTGEMYQSLTNAVKKSAGGMKTLYLPLKKQWYEMIESGEKTEEYREIKTYWWKRLIETRKTYPQSPVSCDSLKRIDAVCFSYGYTKRRMTFECAGITIGKGRQEWGAPNDEVFIIKIGRRVS